MTKQEWFLLLTLQLMVSVAVSAAINIFFPDNRYRAALVECGKAHYDTTTGAFVEHGKEAK